MLTVEYHDEVLLRPIEIIMPSELIDLLLKEKLWYDLLANKSSQNGLDW